jgi:hypothetical protein
MDCTHKMTILALFSIHCILGNPICPAEVFQLLELPAQFHSISCNAILEKYSPRMAITARKEQKT